MSSRTDVLLFCSNDLGWIELRLALTALPGVRIVGETTSLHHARLLASTLKPAVIITGASLEGTPALPLLAEVRLTVSPESKILVIASRFDPQEIKALAEINVVGHLLWSSLSPQALLHCLAALISGDIVMASREVATAFVAENRSQPRTAEASISLSEREMAVLRRLAEGLTHDEITRAEPLSRRTLERTISGLEAKLNAPNLFTLGCKACRLGLIG